MQNNKIPIFFVKIILHVHVKDLDIACFKYYLLTCLHIMLLPHKISQI